MTTSLVMFSKHGVEVLDDQMKERLHNLGYAPSYPNVLRSVCSSMSIAGGYTTRLKDYVEEENIFRGRPREQDQVQPVFS